MAQQKYLGEFTDWFAFEEGKGKARTCYAASRPQKEKGNYSVRGETYILVTHRPAENSRDVFELRAGYTYKKGSEVTLQIDKTEQKLFTDGESAWARNPETDRALAFAMRKGSRLTASGISSRGTKTTDSYSLNGFTAAYKAISQACKPK